MGRWWLLSWFTRDERILTPDEIASALANWHRYGDGRRPSSNKRVRRLPETESPAP